MFELGWLFWIIVAFLFAERSARAWAAHLRGEERHAASGDGASCDSSALAG